MESRGFAAPPRDGCAFSWRSAELGPNPACALRYIEPMGSSLLCHWVFGSLGGGVWSARTSPRLIETPIGVSLLVAGGDPHANGSSLAAIPRCRAKNTLGLTSDVGGTQLACPERACIEC